MKVSLPINMAHTRTEVSVKSTEQAESEAVCTFSNQVNEILYQNEEKEGILGGNAHRHFNHRDSDDDSSGSISRCDLSGTRPDVSGPKTGGAGIEGAPGTGPGDNRAASKEGYSVQGGQSVEGIPLTGGSDTSRISPVGSDRASSRTSQEEFSMPGTQAPENDKSETKVSDKGRQNFSTDSVGEDLHGSSRGSRIKGEPSLLHTGHDDSELDASEPGKLNLAKYDSAQDSSKHRDTVRKTDFTQMGLSSGNEVSARTAEGNTASSGENSESGADPEAYTIAKALGHIGNASRDASGKDPNADKGGQPEIANHISASTARLLESNAPIGGNTVKPTAPQSNEFLSQVTERIQFLIRDGVESVRIRLHPDEFGHMEIRAQSSSRGMTVHISAETGSVKSILESNLHILQQNLQEQGLKVDRIHVELQEFPDSQSTAGHFSKSGHPNSGQNEKGAYRNFDSNKNYPEDASLDNPDAGIWAPDKRFHTVA